jgi:SAM-dependent methyltransferase
MKILQYLKLPEAHQIDDLDGQAATLLHARILQRKGFLKKLYTDFYTILKTAVQADAREKKIIVELGSGGGFIKDVIPGAITSDVLPLASVDRVFSACQMPFDDNCIDAVVMIDVLHHIPDIRAFWAEAVRCLKPGGRIAMIEPANTVWSRFIYTNFHHEAFEPHANWEFESKGRLSTANGALPWIIFHRDRSIFQKDFPQLTFLQDRLHTPLRYLFSGGFTLRQLMPSWSYGMVKTLEWLLTPLNRWIGMFETIVIEKAN